MHSPRKPFRTMAERHNQTAAGRRIEMLIAYAARRNPAVQRADRSVPSRIMTGLGEWLEYNRLDTLRA